MHITNSIFCHNCPIGQQFITFQSDHQDMDTFGRDYLNKDSFELNGS